MAQQQEAVLSEIDLVLGSIEAERQARREATAANFGPRGFGHVHDRSRIVEQEAAAIRDAARRVLDGETLSSIVQEWNCRGLRSTTGGPWRVNALSALLIQPRLAGLHADRAGVLAERFPPILDRSTHERLVALRSSRSLRRRPPRRSLLNGLLRCGRCGGSLHFLYRSEANQYYRCPAPAAGGCSGVIVKSRFAEEFVRDSVVCRVDSQEFLEMARGTFHPVQQVSGEIRGIVAEIHGDLDRLKELAVLWGGRKITRTEWQQARRDIARRLTGNESRLRVVDSAKVILTIAGTGEELADRWPTMTKDQRRAIIRAVVDHVVVEPVGGTGGKFRPERMCPVWRTL
ncbi:MAG: recombinase family protein [Acidimicrobiia bacterium]